MKFTKLLLILLLAGCCAQTVKLERPNIPPAAPPPPRPVAAMPAPQEIVDIQRVASIEQLASEQYTGSAAPPKVVKKVAKVEKVKPDSILDQLTLAAIAFSVPDFVNIKEKVSVRLLIDPTVTPEELEKNLPPSGTHNSAKVAISKIVEATVKAPDFEVTNVTPSKQAIAETAPTEWIWDLTPKAAGTYTVFLTVNAIVSVDGNSAERSIKTFEKAVQIKVTPWQVIVNFFVKYWQWIVTALVIPLGKWLWDKFKS